MNATPSRRSRRRLVAWIVFGLIGISMGAIWASGVASVGSTGSAEDNTPTPLAEDPIQPAATARFAGLITPSTGLSVTWDGRWGSIAADQSLFFVDLSSKSVSPDYWFTLTIGDPQPSGWESLQLLVEVTPTVGSNCTGVNHEATIAGGTGTTAAKVMYIDTSDASVTFSELPGGQKYCIGLNTASGKDTGATFLRRISTGIGAVVYPTFIGILNEDIN